VQALIDHFTQKNLGKPGDSNWELFVLTRHRLANGQRKYSLRQDQAEWQQWWDAKKATVALFSDMECP
jgi:hypothetical protein